MENKVTPCNTVTQETMIYLIKKNGQGRILLSWIIALSFKSLEIRATQRVAPALFIFIPFFL